MKKQMNYALTILLLLFAWSTSQAQIQVITLKTGDANGGLWGTGNIDPNWTACPPGYDHHQPGFFGPVRVCDPVPINTFPTPYSGSLSGVGFLSPNMGPWQSMMHPVENSMQGDWYYKRKFSVLTCQVEYAELYIEHAGADNYISEIIINGYSHAFPYTMGTPFDVHSGITIFIPGSELISAVPDGNEMEIHVVNQGTSPTPSGLEFKAKLNVYAYSTIDASFNMSFAQYSNTLQLGTAYNYGNHTWEVYSSNSGIPGSYNLTGTFQGPEITIGSGTNAAPCYYVKHTLETYCGTACEAYSACKFGCDYIPHDGNFCDLPAPTNLRYDATTHKVSWDPVPGAYQYTVFVYPGDPECCGPTVAKWRNYTTDVQVPEFQITGDIPCFSFKVRAICENGSEGPYSDKYCSNDMVWGFGAGTPTTGIEAVENLKERGTVNMYPNPAKGTVSFDIDMPADISFSMTIVDINGKTVKSVSGMKTSGKKASMTLSTEGISKGAYIVKIVIPNGESISKKLMIE